MLNVIMLNVIMLNVIMLNVIMLNVIMLNVIVTSVVVPIVGFYQGQTSRRTIYIMVYKLQFLNTERAKKGKRK